MPEDSALLEVEVAGIRGTDVKMYAKPPFTAPVIMEYENVDVISGAGRGFTERKGLRTDDRAAGRVPGGRDRHDTGVARLGLAKRSGVDAMIDAGLTAGRAASTPCSTAPPARPGRIAIHISLLPWKENA